MLYFLFYRHNCAISVADEYIFSGIITRRELQKLLNEGDITNVQVNHFYEGVRAFYARALEYALDNLPMKDDLLINAKFVNLGLRNNALFSQVEYFIQRCASSIHPPIASLFSFIPSYNRLLDVLHYEGAQELELVSEEFIEYQLLQETSIPKDEWEISKIIVDGDKTYHRMDIV